MDELLKEQMIEELEYTEDFSDIFWVLTAAGTLYAGEEINIVEDWLTSLSPDNRTTLELAALSWKDHLNDIYLAELENTQGLFLDQLVQLQKDPKDIEAEDGVRDALSSLTDFELAFIAMRRIFPELGTPTKFAGVIENFRNIVRANGYQWTDLGWRK